MKSHSLSDDTQAGKKNDIRDTITKNQRDRQGLDIEDTESQGSQVN